MSKRLQIAIIFLLQVFYVSVGLSQNCLLCEQMVDTFCADCAPQECLEPERTTSFPTLNIPQDSGLWRDVSMVMVKNYDQF